MRLKKKLISLLIITLLLPALAEIQAEDGKNTFTDYKWEQSDSTILLLDGKHIVWQYNFRDMHQKPHFNPVNLGRNNITCVGPDDHPWHAGQWFSWKFINGINYWEYVNKQTYRSEGVTHVRDIVFKPEADFSALIKLSIVYHPVDGEDVLLENRKIHISAPGADGKLSMDYSFYFEALVDSVEIGRTPIEGEPNGQSWGGYGGLSLRFNQSFKDVETLSGWRGETEHAEKGKWFYMGFTGVDGKKIGSQIIISPESNRSRSAWYVTKDEQIPFHYFGPAYVYYKPVVIIKGDFLKLSYRINHLPGSVSFEQLEQESRDYDNQFKN